MTGTGVGAAVGGGRESGECRPETQLVITGREHQAPNVNSSQAKNPW